MSRRQLDASDKSGGGRGLLSRFATRAAPAVPIAPVLDDARIDDQEALRLLRNYEATGQGWFWSTDAEGRIRYLSGPVAEKLGIAGETAGAIFSSLFAAHERSDDNQRPLSFLMARKGRFDQIEVRSRDEESPSCWSITGVPQLDENEEFSGFSGFGIDITDQRIAVEQSMRLTKYDALTGLLNRFRMGQLLDSTLSAYAVQNRNCAIMLLDLDRFKAVNDTLGHPAGDALLKQVADRLVATVGDRERISRLGGDEFQIIIPDMDDRGELGTLATEIIHSLSQPYSVEGSRCIIGASVGMAIYPFDGAASDTLIRNADLALYAAKGGGRGRFRFFSEELLKAAADRRSLEEDLVDALAQGQFEAHYQPIVSTIDNRVTGFEALIRWNHPTRGFVPPSTFIPIAEETDQIGALGEWMLRQACQDAANWPGDLRVAVNISAVQFANARLPKLVAQALMASGLRAERLEIELTESVFLGSSSEIAAMFDALKQLGVRLALDDFGTGYSSLAYLQTAPFDKIKIDQSFVRTATERDSRSAAIITAIVSLANAMHMDTTAEGIETLDQLDLMQRLGVSQIQGFVYSQAVRNEELVERCQSGDWFITPHGPPKQRHRRISLLRKAGVVHENHYYPVVVRNLSSTGALIEGLIDVPVGTQLVVDLGEGQLALGAVVRSKKHQQGVLFEQKLVDDGNGGLCTAHRVPRSLLAAAGLPTSPEGIDISRLQNSDYTKTGLPAFQTGNGALPLTERLL
jgi:diguanylate cyclase (GGDEF)-like protein